MIRNLKETIRIEKAIEIKKNFKRLLKQNMDDVPELQPFCKAINEWVRDNKYASGNVYVKSLNKYVIYQLDAPEHTAVKVTEELIS